MKRCHKTKSTTCLAASFLLAQFSLHAATFGTVVTIVGEPSDLVLDESRGRLYLVNSSQNRIEVYSPAQKALLTPIPVDQLPISAAMSRDSRYLYVTSYNVGRARHHRSEQRNRGHARQPALRARGRGCGIRQSRADHEPGTGTAASPQNTMLLYDPSSAPSPHCRSRCPVPPLRRLHRGYRAAA